MSLESETKIVFAKFCPLLIREDPENLVSAHFDPSTQKISEAYCNHTGVPRVEKNTSDMAISCDGCEEFMEGFKKVLAKT